MRKHIAGGLALALLSSTAFGQSISGPTGTVNQTGTTVGAIISDDPTNALGLGTVAIARGAVDLLKVAGLVTGTGQTTAVRQSNATLINNAIAVAISNNDEFDCPNPVNIEFDNTTGITVAPSSIKARLNKACNFIQFHVNAPIFTFGDPAANSLMANADWDGGEFNYGVSQTGNTAAVCVTIGAAASTIITNVAACTTYGTNTPLNPPYDDMVIGKTTGYSGSQAFFSTYMSHITLGGAQRNLLYVGLPGTGSIFEDFYGHNGSSPSSAQPLTGSAWSVNAGQNRSDDWWIRDNFEHISGTNLVGFQNVSNMKVISPHFEDIQMAGYGDNFAILTNAQVEMDTLELLDVSTLASNVPSNGTVNFFKLNYGSSLRMNSPSFKWSNGNEFNSTGAYLFAGTPGKSSADDVIEASATNIVASDPGGTAASNLNTANILLEPSIPIALSVLQKVGTYTYDPFVSRTDRGEFFITAGNFTLFGQNANASVEVNAALTAANTITIADVFHSGGSIPTDTGNKFRVRRLSNGTYANTTAVVDGGGSNITTFSAAGSEIYGRFNGTANVAGN